MLNRTHLLASIALFALPTAAFAQEAPQADDAAPATLSSAPPTRPPSAA